MQKPDGSWPPAVRPVTVGSPGADAVANLVDTAFALLFLSRGATPPADVVYSAEDNRYRWTVGTSPGVSAASPGQGTESREVPKP